MSRKIRAGVVAVAATTLTLTACGSNIAGGGGNDAGAGNEGPILAGVIVDQTAYLKSLDENVLKGIKCAVDSVNAQGGVLGRDLKIEVQDNAADPQKQVQAYQRLLGDHPAVFLNGFSSASNAATAPLAAKDEVPLIVASVVPEDQKTWAFSTIVPAQYETGIRVEYLAEQGIKRVGILNDPTPYGGLQVQAAQSQLKEAGIEIVGVQEHPTDAVDLRSQVSNLLSAGAQAIIKVSAGPTQIVAAKALADAGSTVPLLIGIDSYANITQATAANPNVIGVVSPLQVVSQLPKDKITEGMKRFMDACGDVQDPTYVGRGWDAVLLATSAMEKAGTTKGPALRDAIEKMGPYEGTSAAYDYTADDHYGITKNPNYLAKITTDSVEIVYTPKG